MSAKGTATENLAHWIDYQLKDLSRQHPPYLLDIRHLFSYKYETNKKHGTFGKEKLWFIRRNIESYNPSYGTKIVP